MTSNIATLGGRPTESQKRWLAGIFGQELWSELCAKAEFHEALETSIDVARRIGLRHLAEKERRKGVLEQI